MRRCTQEEEVLRKSINLFFVLFLVLGGILGGMVALLYQAQVATHLDDLKIRERYVLELQSNSVKASFTAVVGDLLFLAGQNELQALLNSDDPGVLEGIKSEYERFLSRKMIYDQLRFLDETGQEVVRVNYNDGNPAAVKKSVLQNKARRYYFLETFKLDCDDVFVSPMDLNVENGEIEQPLKPMIRFGTPVFDARGRKQGIVILNYLARNLLEAIQAASGPDQGTPMLLNSKGYWLLGERAEDEWGFMLPGRIDSTFARRFPDEWARMQGNVTGQMRTPNGLFTFKTVYPMQEGISSCAEVSAPGAPSAKELDSSEYFWVLLSYVSREDLDEYVGHLRLRMFFLGAGLFVFIALVAWYLALAITKRRIYECRLLNMALYDALTGLPNRKLFYDRLEGGLDNAKRHGRLLGILYIDLDGFKAVNDTHGHEAGDELLIRVGEMLQQTSRKSDVVARLGGDEFIILLLDITSPQDALTAGNKIIAALSEPIALETATVSIGASIGAAVYPETATDQEALLQSADAAMYRSKAGGKNICTMAEPAGQPDGTGQA